MDDKKTKDIKFYDSDGLYTDKKIRIMAKMWTTIC